MRRPTPSFGRGGHRFAGLVAATVLCAVSVVGLANPAAAAEPTGTAFGEPCGAVTIVAVPGSTETTEAAGKDLASSVLAGATSYITEISDASIQTHYIGYPARLVPYGPSKDQGYAAIWSTIDHYSRQCPSTQFVLLGYSQGAHVVGDLAATIGNESSPVSPDRVRSVRLLADPARAASSMPLVGMEPEGRGMFGGRTFGSLDGKVTEYCARYDFVCNNTGDALDITALGLVFGTGPHTGYDVAQVPGTDKTYTQRISDDLISDVLLLNAPTF